MQRPPSMQALTLPGTRRLLPQPPRFGCIDSGEANALAISGTIGRIRRWTWRLGW
jgi:hypothetical protein